MEERRSNKICVIGVGNPIRSDDGIGAYICSKIEDLKIANVTTEIVQQLDAEMVEDLLQYDYIVITDASVQGDDVEFYPLEQDDAVPLSSSHCVNATMVAAIAGKIYGKQLSIYVCAVKGKDFGIGERLSKEAKANCASATQIISNWISNLS